MLESLNDLTLTSAALITIAPAVWNGIGRFEYATKAISGAFGSNVLGCYFLTTLVMLVSRTRDVVFMMVVLRNMEQYAVPLGLNYFVGVVLVAVGMTFVVSSNYKLGILGTHMGDHFGLYLDAKLTCFPFSVLENPMYTGSATAMLGFAVMFNSAIGVALALFAFVVYNAYSKLYEERFTSYIYEQKAKNELKKAKKN